jgi:hypothetical protein
MPVIELGFQFHVTYTTIDHIESWKYTVKKLQYYKVGEFL